LVECEKKGALTDHAFPPMEISFEYSLKQKQKMNADTLKESLKIEHNNIKSRQQEKSVRKEHALVDESSSQDFLLAICLKNIFS